MFTEITAQGGLPPPPTPLLICRMLTELNTPLVESSLLRTSWGGAAAEIAAPFAESSLRQSSSPFVESSLHRTSWGGLPPPPNPPADV